MKSGFVGLVGRPNVGKSTLVNSIVGKKVAITTNKPQTTRNLIQGVYNDDDTQIVLMDTPGIHKPTHKLGEYLNKQAYYSINDTDVVMMLVSADEELGTGDKFVIEKLKTVNKPVILVINKIDKIKKEEILLKITQYKELYDFTEIVPVSALKKDNVKTLIEVIKKYLPDSIRYFGEDDFTNRSLSFLISETVREKVMDLTEEEVPHSITCILENMEKNNQTVSLYVTIIVDRDSLKKIVIGKQGQMLKEIGTRSRIELEKLLNKKVYLNLYVKTIKNWRDREKYLQELGFKELDSE